MSQAYGHSHHSQFIVLACCTAPQTKPLPNVALRSPRKAAIECAAWVSSTPSHRCRLAITLHLGAHPYCNSDKNKSNSSVVGRPGLSVLFGGCCYLFPPHCCTHSTTPSVKKVQCEVWHNTSSSAEPALCLASSASHVHNYKGVSTNLASHVHKNRGFRGVDPS